MSANSKLFQRTINSFTSSSNDAPSVIPFYNGVNQTPATSTTKPLNLYGWNIYNPNSYDIFVKLFDSDPNGAGPVLGVDTPVYIIQVPTVNSVVLVGADVIVPFSLTLWVAATKLYPWNDTTAITIGCVPIFNVKI